MARVVIHKDKKPYELKTAEGVLLICKCGLTKREDGLCDDFCKKIQDEDPAATYIYSDDGERDEVDLINDTDFDDDDFYGHGGCACGGGSCGCGSHSDSASCGCCDSSSNLDTDNGK